MRNVPPGIHTMFSNGGLPGASDSLCVKVTIEVLPITCFLCLNSLPKFSSHTVRRLRELLHDLIDREACRLLPRREFFESCQELPDNLLCRH